MRDISEELVNIMSQNNCSSVYALFALKENNDVRTVQPESTRELCGRLCNKSNIKGDEQGLG